MSRNARYSLPGPCPSQPFYARSPECTLGPGGKYVRPAFLEDSGDFQKGAKPLHLYFAFVGVFFSNIPSLNQSCHY